ncbi:MAG: hypothetical protein R3Y16_01600 [Rikenellaceae bacterium]
MVEFDTETEEGEMERAAEAEAVSLTPTPENFDFEVDHQMEDHDLFLTHVAQEDSELYALDCCMSEIFRG